MYAYASIHHTAIVELFQGNEVNNDISLDILSKTALSHAVAGADIVAPSAMMDGQVKSIRDILDDNEFKDTLIMGYSAKQASSFFRHLETQHTLNRNLEIDCHIK